MPRKRVPKTTAAQVSVVRALRHSGFSKAGTPSEIASTPVSATAPELNERRMSSSDSTWSAAGGLDVVHRRRDVVRQGAGGLEDEAPADQPADGEDVQVGRGHEQRPRLADPAQVADA